MYHTSILSVFCIVGLGLFDVSAAEKNSDQIPAAVTTSKDSQALSDDDSDSNRSACSTVSDRTCFEVFQDGDQSACKENLPQGSQIRFTDYCLEHPARILESVSEDAFLAMLRLFINNYHYVVLSFLGPEWMQDTEEAPQWHAAYLFQSVLFGRILPNGSDIFIDRVISQCINPKIAALIKACLEGPDSAYQSQPGFVAKMIEHIKKFESQLNKAMEAALKSALPLEEIEAFFLKKDTSFTTSCYNRWEKVFSEVWLSTGDNFFTKEINALADKSFSRQTKERKQTFTDKCIALTDEYFSVIKELNDEYFAFRIVLEEILKNYTDCTHRTIESRTHQKAFMLVIREYFRALYSFGPIKEIQFRSFLNELLESENRCNTGSLLSGLLKAILENDLNSSIFDTPTQVKEAYSFRHKNTNKN